MGTMHIANFFPFISWIRALSTYGFSFFMYSTVEVRLYSRYGCAIFEGQRCCRINYLTKYANKDI